MTEMTEYIPLTAKDKMIKTKENIPLTATETARTSNARRCKIHGVVQFLDDEDWSNRRMIRSFVMALIVVCMGILCFVFGVSGFSAMNGVWPITPTSNCSGTIDYSDDIPVVTINLTAEGNTTQSPDPWFPDQLEIRRSRGQVLMWLQLTAMLVTCLLLLLAINYRCPACLSSLISYISFFCFLVGVLMVVCCVVWPVSLEAANCATAAGFLLGFFGFVSSALIFLITALGLTCNYWHLRNMSTDFCGCCYLGNIDSYENL